MSHSSNRSKNRKSQKLETPRKTKKTRPFQGLELLDSRTLFANVFVSVFHDLNGNGIRDVAPEEGKLEGWTVFADYNHDAILNAGEPSAVTDIDGEARISGITQGTRDIREVLPPGWSPSPGLSAVQTIVVKANGGSDTDPEFLNVTSLGGTIEGTVWNDINGDGIRDAEDEGLSGWTVYLDENGNNDFDFGETSTLTNLTGFYSITDLPAGSYRISEVTPSGWDTTLGYDSHNNVDVAPGEVVVSDFGNFSTVGRGTINGTVWNDINADGFRAAGDLGMEGWTVYLDINNNGALDGTEPSTLSDVAGAYTFPSLLPGTYHVNEILQAGYTASPGHPASVTIAVASEGTPVVDFANYTPANGGVSGRVWSDANGDGLMNVGEPGLSGWTVYVDENGDGNVTAGEPSAVTNANGDYALIDVAVGTNVIREVPAIGFTPTAPGTGMQTVNVPNATTLTNINFGNKQRTDGAISGNVYVDANHDGIRNSGERGLPGITVYIDANNSGTLDAGEKSLTTSIDLFYTPANNEAGNYSFDKLPAGNYTIREIVPIPQNATLPTAMVKNITLAAGEDRQGINFGNNFRANEIHGVKFDDINKNHVRDAGEPTQGGITVFIDSNRNNLLDAGEPSTVTGPDGSYAFTGLTPGAYVVRAMVPHDHETSYPATVGGILWPAGVSNAPRGNVTTSAPLTFSLAQGETYSSTVTITIPTTGAVTNMADVFLLFDDTGSFTGNSPIVRAAFPQIISSLQTSLPGLDLGFGVGRFEEYGNFAAEFGTGRPFVLNQPIVSQSTVGYDTAIQSALNRTTPGYGGDGPETDIEALYQTVTGAGFDGNNNGNTSDSGAAGLANTQINPGVSGDVPAFSSFTPDTANGVLPSDGTIGGAGFRFGALPVILLATDIGLAYQPKGETSITGANGLTLPLSQLTQVSRNTTPFNSGAGIQETVTALNALGALVIGLGTNPQANVDPRQQLEALSSLTGSTNTTTTTIANGTADPIAPGDPFYFQIASGFGASVANGVTAAIQNAVTNTSVNIAVRSSDPTVLISMTPSVVNGVGAGETATFNVTFTGDGRPHRFDLQFVKQGTNVIIGSLPVVMGTPIAGDGYEYEDLEEGEIEDESDFGSYSVSPVGGVISGQIYEDRDSDETHDAGEPAFSAVTVYLDLNNNNALDTGEPSTVTDAAGNYTFTGIADGNYYVRQVKPAHTHNSGPKNVSLAASSATGTNFGDIPIVFEDHSGSTTFHVSGNGDRSDISVDGVPTYSILKSAVPSLTFSGTSGDDTVIIDSSSSDPAPAGGISFIGGDANDLIEVRGSGTGDSFSLASAGSISHGSSTIDYTGTKKVKLVDGDFDVTTDLTDLDLTVSGSAAHATLRRGEHLAKLAIDAGALVTSASTDAASPAMVIGGVTITDGILAIAPNGGKSGVSKFGSLSISPTGKIDLHNNDLVIDYGTGPSPEAAIRASILSGLTTLGGSGLTGIGSTEVDANSDGTVLAVIDNAVVGGSLTGLSGYTDFSGNSILVKFTWFGDANLDGQVDGADYALTDTGFTSGGTLAGWVFGDLNYDGVVSGDDYALVDTGFIAQNAVL